MATQATPTPDAAARFAMDVREGLSREGQKQLPSKYLYDPLGFALFEAISRLPEYGLTRADERLLQAHAREMVKHVAGPAMVCELGSGSGRKTRWVLEMLLERGPVPYYPIEISPAALALCESELGGLRGVSVRGIAREYLEGLREAGASRAGGVHLLVLFLGSTIGNFDRGADARFLREVRDILAPGDSLLLGTDLVKPRERMLAAYDDPLGVTACFNLNLLGRINRELGGDFDLREFEHVALFNESSSSIEMHLRSERRQAAHIRGCDLTVNLTRGETIWTESSHKYSLEGVEQLAAASGFRIERQWVDKEWPFAESLFLAV